MTDYNARWREWCPECGGPIVSVTRGIPSMGTCAGGHTTDRRDCLRREPVKEETDIDKMLARAEAAEAACEEWVAVSQSNYQRAKKAESRIRELEKALATLRDWHQSNQAKLQAAYAIANRPSWDKKNRALSEEIHAALKGGDA